jgi:hypothetical protein
MTVEEFQNEFAQPHCAVEAKRFLPHPQGAKSNFRTRARRCATIKQTSNKQRSGANKVALSIAFCAIVDQINTASNNGDAE